MTDFKHWQLSHQNNVSYLVLDKTGADVNVLNHEVIDELAEVVTHLEQNPVPSLVLSSGKANGFLAGADISEFLDVEPGAGVKRQIERGQQLFLRIEHLPFKTVAAIHGPCLGGGLELALACDYRVATDDKATKLGLPEVKLGIHPGYGGVVRLPQVMDSLEALNLMLNGSMINGKRAKAYGMVDVLTQQRHLLEAATDVATGKVKPKRKQTLKQKLLQYPQVRKLLVPIVRKQIAKQAKPDHYPAPYHLLDCWAQMPRNSDADHATEAASFVGLTEDTHGARAIENLVRVFLMDSEAKAVAKAADCHVKHVHVIGAGVMGGDIAAWCAMQGLTVTLQDAKLAFIAPAIQRAHKLFKRRLKQPHLVAAAMDRLLPDVDATGVPQADLIIEAITERLDAKQGLFAAIEPRMKPGAILATNTSSIALEKLAQGLAEPTRLVGIHYFNPVAQMPLVEVVRGEQTSPEVLAQALAFVNAIGKLPLEVKSSPGFLVNRVLMTYVSEAMRLYEEGVSPTLIDKAAIDFGMPMGPIEMADTVGLDICQAVATELFTAFGGDDTGVCQRLIDQGKLGKKSGEGFYVWTKGKPQKPEAEQVVTADISDRMIYAFINETVACLDDGIIASNDAADIGMIFGSGFAPFRGGPIKYLKTEGAQNVKARLEQLAKEFGPRFEPAAGIGNLE